MASKKEQKDVDAFKMFSASTQSYLQDIAKAYADSGDDDVYQGSITKARLVEETERVLGELEEVEHIKEERDISAKEDHEYALGMQHLQYAVSEIEQANQGVLPDEVEELKEHLENRYKTDSDQAENK